MVLLPKKKCPEKVEDYGHVSLCYFIYRLIPKSLCKKCNTFSIKLSPPCSLTPSLIDIFSHAQG